MILATILPSGRNLAECKWFLSSSSQIDSLGCAVAPKSNWFQWGWRFLVITKFVVHFLVDLFFEVYNLNMSYDSPLSPIAAYGGMLKVYDRSITDVYGVSPFFSSLFPSLLVLLSEFQCCVTNIDLSCRCDRFSALSVQLASSCSDLHCKVTSDRCLRYMQRGTLLFLSCGILMLCIGLSWLVNSIWVFFFLFFF